MTTYEEVYSRFLSKIEDIDLPKLSTEHAEGMLKQWLNSAISFMELDRLKLKNDLSDRDSTKEVFNVTLENYEIEVIAMYMQVAWYELKVNSLEHTLLFMGTKDEKWTSQKDHWRLTKDIQDEIRKRARKYCREHSMRYNSYITDDYGVSETTSTSDGETTD